MSGRAAASEGLTGPGGSSFKPSHTRGCWQEASVSHHVALSIERHEHPHSVAAGFPKSRDVAEQDKAGTSCLSIRSHTVISPASYRMSSQPAPRGMRLQAVSTRKQGQLEVILEAEKFM